MKAKELKHNPKLWSVVVLLFVLVGVALISKFRAKERRSSSSGIQSAELSSGIHLLRLQGTGTYTNYNRDGTPHTNGAIGSVTFLTDFTNWAVAYASGNDPLKEEVTFLDAGCYHVTRNALVDHGPRRVDLAVWKQGQQPDALFPSARLAWTGAYLCGLLPNTQLDLAPPWIPVSPPVPSAYAMEINAEKTEVNILTSSNRLAAAEKEEQKRRPRMSIPFVTQDTPADDFLRAQLRVLKTTTFRGDTVPMQVELKIFHTPAKTRIGRFKVRTPLLGYDVQTACSFQVTNISVCEGPIVPPVLPKPVQFSSGGSFFIITNGLWPDFIAVANEQARPEPGPKPGYVPLDLELPHPPTQLISWTPSDASNTNLESFPPKLRPKFYVPPGVQNVSLGKNVSSSVNDLPAPALHRLADGQREPIETNVLLLPGGVQWVQLDLGREYTLHAILLWHDFLNLQVFHDVIVQASDDPSFQENVRTLFNNDHDNSSGLGRGTDKEYYETHQGKLIDPLGAAARYLRFSSNGSTGNPSNSYVEIEVYGLPLK